MWEIRQATLTEQAEYQTIDLDTGEDVPLFVVMMDGDDQTGPLTAATIKRYFDLEVQQ